MIVTTKRLNALYKAMIKEAKGPATMNYLLALMSRNDELKLENEMLRTALADDLTKRGKKTPPDSETPS